MRIKLVLIVAAEEVIADYIRRALREVAGVQLVRVADPGHARRFIQSVRPALILIDLPSHSECSQFCADVRANPTLSRVPVLVLKAGDPEQIQRLAAAGATAVLPQPLDLVALSVRVRQWFDETANGYGETDHRS